MFMINRFGKFFFGEGSKESVIEVSDGQLYLVRPLSPKGYSELIYKDAGISLRRTGTEYNYQLVVTRVFEEGEEELLAEEEGEENLLDQNEQSFLLDEALQFRVTIREGGEKVFAWRDLDGSEGDLWEFVCDFKTQPDTVEAFQVAAFRCQFERKFKKPADEATEADLAEFSFLDEPIPAASPILAPSSSRSPTISPSPTSTRLLTDGAAAEAAVMSPSAMGKLPAKSTVVPQADTVGRDELCRERGELHLYDIEARTFVLHDEIVELTVFDLGGFNYWMKISGNKGSLVGRSVTEDLAPVFNFEYLSFIFNVFEEAGSARSWLLRVKDQPTLERVQQGVMQATWEHLNRVKWTTKSDAEQEYLINTLNDMELTDAPADEEEEESEDDDSDVGRQSEHYDSDESDDDVEVRDKDGNVNSLLAVGAKNDRSFVVRGSKIGVFKHTEDNHLEFATTISKVQNSKGKLFSPTKVMLHASDRNLILQDPNSANSVYRMDLETGKVVDEWKVHDDIGIKTFAPEEKFGQLTDKQTFLGLSNNAMYRVDPRLAGNKLVGADMKQYKTKGLDFTSVTTTENGYIAVGDAKGDVRLYDTLGKVAKTALPAVGGAIIGLDVSADGRYVLATCKTYILLIDTVQKEGKFEGRLGFERAFPADKKPTPYRLSLTPPHIAEFQHQTGKPLSFTPARFNTGVDNKETTIVTATGPFIITWSLKKVLDRRRDPYSIKRYSEEVKADNFRFGSDKGIIVALPNEVDFVKKAALKKPTRESIAPPRLSEMRGARKSRGYMSRGDIVNEAY